jgi:hypothetical protein
MIMLRFPFSLGIPWGFSLSPSYIEQPTSGAPMSSSFKVYTLIPEEHILQ